MKYFVLTNSTGSEVGKTYPQTEGMSYNDNAQGNDFVSNLPILEVPNFIPDLHSVRLSSDAKLTDVISSGLFNQYSFLVNKKVKDLFNQFNLPKHAFFEASLLQYDGTKENYFLFHLQESYSTLIDFRYSIFSTQSLPPWDIPTWNYKKMSVEINSHEKLIDLNKECSVSKDIVPENLVLTNKFNQGLDLFTLEYLNDKVLISQKLKNAIEKNNIIGFSIEEVSYDISFTN